MPARFPAHLSIGLAHDPQAHRLAAIDKSPEAYFTGAVRMDPLNSPPEPARAAIVSVTFEPGARSAWHTHPLGQTLIVTAGCGWTQCDGEPIVEIRAGDVIWRLHAVTGSLCVAPPATYEPATAASQNQRTRAASTAAAFALCARG